MKKYAAVLALSAVMFLCAGLARAKTLVLEGEISGRLSVSQERHFSVPPGGLRKLKFRFANPATFKETSMSQTTTNHSIAYSPQPDSVKTETDYLGNAFTVATWENLRQDVVVKETFDVGLDISLNDVKSAAPFPLAPGSVTAAESVYLKPTPLVQSDDESIKKLAARLTAGQTTEQGAVTAVLDWVIDNIRYKTPIPNYDAVWTLSTKHGNCQNYAHVVAALLRSQGIPARVVGGMALGKTWRVPIENGALLQSIGQGGHAWTEVWYPDIGWVPYDAQQSHLFVGPRHIKQTAGLDSNDINDTWMASPVLPAFREDISAEYLKDEIGLTLKETAPRPQGYIMATSIAPVSAVVTPPAAPPAAVAPPPEPVKAGTAIELGNTDFPSLMDFYVKTGGDVGKKTFDKETAEYVTGTDTYAQPFTVAASVRIETISLAMHKFGGRFGSLWVDIVADDNGRPGMEGVRSLPLNLDTVKYYPGYKWFDFAFYGGSDEKPVLKPGRYWVILRHSKDAVVNWFYSPGSMSGTSEYARSTATGTDWSNLLNFNFNFRVRGAASD